MFEKNYPFVLSLLLTVFYFFSDKLIQTDISSFFNTSLNLFSILIGFLLTVSTLINSLDNDAIRFIRNSDKYSVFVIYLRVSIIYSLYTLLLIIFNVLFNNMLKPIALYTNSIQLFFITFSILACFRFIKIFIKIVVRE